MNIFLILNELMVLELKIAFCLFTPKIFVLTFCSTHVVDHLSVQSTSYSVANPVFSVCPLLTLLILIRHLTQCAQSCETLQPYGLQLSMFLCSMEFSKQEYWSGQPFPSPGNLPHPGIEPRSPALQEDCLPLSHQGSI